MTERHSLWYKRFIFDACLTCWHLELILYATMSVSITWWAYGLELPSSKPHLELDTLRMCISKGGLWPTHLQYHRSSWESAWEGVCTCLVRCIGGILKTNPWKAAHEPALQLSSLACLTSCYSLLKSLQSSTLCPFATFLWGHWSLTLVAYKRDE